MNNPSEWPDLSGVAEAIQHHDARNFHGQMMKADTNEAVSHVVVAEHLSLTQVRLAFFEATKDRNCKDNCMIVDLATLREWIAKAAARRD